ncbi:MAG: hypothetical protein ABW252_23355 [Polyangiales bacterium]
MLAARRLLSLLVPCACALGCGDLKEFRGAYEGVIVEGNFVRSCFAADTRVTLRFDPDEAIARSDAGELVERNTISTSDGTFRDTPLEPIASLPHDPLSQFDFPGPQRLRNYLLLARPETGPLAGRDATVVISLLASEGLEVRIIARGGDGMPCPLYQSDASTTPSAAPSEWFGLFRLKK